MSVFLQHQNRNDIREFGEFESSTREAFGDHKFVKIADQLKSGTDDVKLINLSHLNNALHKPTVCIAAMRAGSVPVLTDLVDSGNPRIRQRAVEALGYIAATRTGRQAMTHDHTLQRSVHLLDDEDPDVLSSILRLFNRVSMSREGVADLMNCDVVPRIISLLAVLSPNHLSIALDILHGVMLCSFGLELALNSNAVASLTQVLQRADGDKERAAKNLSLLMLTAQGQQIALDCGSVQVLSLVLSSNANLETKRRTASALAGLTVLQGSKHMAVEIGLPSVIIALIGESEDPELLSGLLQTTVNISELAVARAALKPALSKFKSLAPIVHVEKAVIQLEREN